MCSKCNNSKLLNQTKNGSLIKFESCNTFQLSFSQFVYEFSEVEFDGFCTFINNINIDYWKDKYANVVMTRKIPIPTQQANLYIMLNVAELRELRGLVSIQGEERVFDLLTATQINYDVFLN